MTRAASDWSSLDQASETVERLAVLLAAGIPPSAAWGYLAESETGNGNAAQVVRAVARSEAGNPIGEAILDAVETLSVSPHSASPHLARTGERSQGSKRSAREARVSEGSAWRGLAAAWIVATDAGAPLSQGLLDFAGSLRALAHARRDASVALSGPVATAKLVLALPVVGILFGMALGFDSLGTLFTTFPGLVCLVSGGLLLLAGRAWNRRLVAASTPADLTPGLVLDLFAIAVSGGASLDRARRAVSNALERCCVEGSEEDADSVLALASRAGVPAGALLRSEADRIRRDSKSDTDRRAARLAVTLMMPLGLCVLPAFMLVGVAPLMIAVLSSTVGVF